MCNLFIENIICVVHADGIHRHAGQSRWDIQMDWPMFSLPSAKYQLPVWLLTSRIKFSATNSQYVL